MKKTIIIFLAMVFFMAIPTLASTPENENAPAMTSEDQQFMGLTQLSEEELLDIIGNYITSGALNNDTDRCDESLMLARQLQRDMLYQKLAKEQSLIYKLIHNFKIPAAVASMIVASAYEAIQLANQAGNYSLTNVIEYVVIGIAIADPAFLTAIGTAALVALVTYTITVVLE
jgi:hypothetical protein